MKRLFVLLLVMYCSDSLSQMHRLGVQGSSTANGQGVPFDSGWAIRVKTYYKDQGFIDTFHRIAASTYDIYNGMWTGYVPPPGRNSPNISYNCTRLITRSPKPTIVIINYPSTSYDWLPAREVIERFNDLKNFYESQQVKCFIATTQPREGYIGQPFYTYEDRLKLKHLRDTIIQVFGDRAIDFYTPLADPVTLKRRPEFALVNDVIHVNSAGHAVLAQQVLAKSIFNPAPDSPLAVFAGYDSTIVTTDSSMIFDLKARLSGLKKGEYEVVVKITDSIGAVVSDTVKIHISSPAPININPVANAGNDITITLPQDSVVVSGSGQDTDGNIASYYWQVENGPGAAHIVSPDSAQTMVHNLIEGVYTLTLKVTDNNGASHTDTAHITVLAAVNQIPVSNAGTDTTIQLPLDSIMLAGSGYDQDGTISFFKWLLLDGPGNAAIVHSDSAHTLVTNLSEGVYTFRLDVTDNSGALDSDSVSVTVLPAVVLPANILPIANAGMDLSITLPADSISLLGEGFDPDGVITGYSWKMIEGPGAALIIQPDNSQTVVRDLLEGLYRFVLEVTDDSAATSFDTVVVTVHPAPPLFENQRILIDLGQAATQTVIPDNWGKIWNNVTDLRSGLRLDNARTTTGLVTSVKFQVLSPIGSVASYDANVSTSGTIGVVGDYPASATTDNGFANINVTGGKWRFYDLDPAKVYTIKFWGTRSNSGARFIQIKRTTESTWKEYNASLNTNFNTACEFNVTGVSEVVFDIRVKAGSTFSYINVIDIGISQGAAMKVQTEKTPIAFKADLKLFPNPGTGMVQLEMDNVYNGDLHFRIYNASGQVLKQFKTTKSSTKFNYQMDLGMLKAGLYQIEMLYGQEARSLSFLKE